jgi:RNA polymerase sigma-70 factor (ECF subfamily)
MKYALVATPAPSAKVIEAELIALLPTARRFAFFLAGSSGRAEDVLQDTMIRAWENAHRFQAGTNLKAWVFTILRNVHYSELRKSHRPVHSFGYVNAFEPAVPPNQDANLEFGEFDRIFRRLSNTQRQALFLVGANGLSYEESARMCGCPVGTMKSRVSRGRSELRRALAIVG